MRRVNGIAVAWRVSIRRRGSTVERIFSVKAFGNLKKALRAAIAFRDEVNQIFPPLTKQEAHAIRRSTNTSGVPGVYRTKMDEWKASIRFEDGKCKTRQFSVRVYGEDGARQLAIDARVELLKQVRGHLIYHDEKIKIRSSDCVDEPAVCIAPHKEKPASSPYCMQTNRNPGVGTVNVKTVLADGQVVRVQYRVAQFIKPDGLPKRRYFSVARYGEKEAERLAIAQRQAWEREGALKHQKLLR
nr:AP2/ERF family transcription factor [Paracidovorax citrulli]